jgi:hypothetical protein
MAKGRFVSPMSWRRATPIFRRAVFSPWGEDIESASSGPGVGETLWYTCTATLNGEESGFATAVSKTNLVDVGKIFLFFRRKHIPHAKKIAFLLFLLLLAGFLSSIRFRMKKAEGKRR